MADIKGVSPDTEIVTNKDGGKQSKSEYGFHLIDTDAIVALAEVLQIGANRYARDNWRKIPSEEHFNHMMVHYYAWKSGDTSDDHLGHMFCRAMMVYATGKAEMIDLPFACKDVDAPLSSDGQYTNPFWAALAERVKLADKEAK